MKHDELNKTLKELKVGQIQSKQKKVLKFKEAIEKLEQK